MTSKNQETNQTNRNLQWGEHNPKLKDENFIDRRSKVVHEKAERAESIDLAQTEMDIEEPGRRKIGTKEGENNLKLQ